MLRANLKWKLMTRLVGSCLLLMLAIGTISCERSIATTSPEIANPAPIDTLKNTAGPLSEVNTPTGIFSLASSLDKYQPQVKILSPQPDSVLTDDRVSVRLQVSDLPLFRNPELGLGNHLHVILDKQTYRGVYDLTQPLVFDNLAAGTHTLRVFASRPWHESFKNQGAYAQATFHVLTKTAENNPAPQQPLLTYSRPAGKYGAEPIMLDYYLTNLPDRQVSEAHPELQHNWKIRATVNNQRFIIDRWEPLYLTGFQRGKNWVRLELIDDRGNPIPNVYNDTVSVFEYDPQIKDTLARLVSGEISSELARALVDPSSVVANQPTPTPPNKEPTIAPVPVVEPAIIPTPKPSTAVSNLPQPTNQMAPAVVRSSPSPRSIEAQQPQAIPSPIVVTPTVIPSPIAAPVVAPTPTPSSVGTPTVGTNPLVIITPKPQPSPTLVEIPHPISPSPAISPPPQIIPMPVAIVPQPRSLPDPVVTSTPQPHSGSLAPTIPTTVPVIVSPPQPYGESSPPTPVTPSPQPVKLPGGNSIPTPAIVPAPIATAPIATAGKESQDSATNSLGLPPLSIPIIVNPTANPAAPGAIVAPHTPTVKIPVSANPQPILVPIPIVIPPVTTQVAPAIPQASPDRSVPAPRQVSQPQVTEAQPNPWQAKAIEFIQFAGVKIRAFTNTIPAKAQKFGHHVQNWAGQAIELVRSWQNREAG